MPVEIRAATQQDIPLLTMLVSTVFRDVAERFHLTLENCPKHPSNCVPEWFETAMTKGIRYYILEDHGTPCGCVALEQAKPEVGYLERLAVLPQYRKRGFGEALVAHVFAEAQKLGIKRVEIGIIAEQAELRAWYEKLGFVITREAEFSHLPFRVTFMVKNVDSQEVKS
jgi:N-acetylglutamate synthase-like GNAT family acetyltransferase